MRYWSTTHKQWRALLWRLRADPWLCQRRTHSRPNEMKEGKVLFFEQTDNLAGKAIYRMNIAEASTDRLVFDVGNVSTIPYLLLTLFHPGEMQSLFSGPESDSVWRYYSMVRTGKNASRPITENESSTVSRAAAFYRYTVGIPTDQEPPAAR